MSQATDSPLKLAASKRGDDQHTFKEDCTIIRASSFTTVPVIDSMVPNPGQKTAMSMSFIMHGDMSSRHDFRVLLRTNDPCRLPLSVYRVNQLRHETLR